MEGLPQEHLAQVRQRVATPPDGELDLPGFRRSEAANDLRMSQLVRTIEDQIIPRLMLAHRTATEPLVRPTGSHCEITDEDVHQFAKLVLALEEDIAFTTIHLLRARNVPIEKIYLDLLAPTARYLGKLWEDDLCNFTDVTVGLGRLQRVLRELSPALGQSVEHAADGRRVLLLPSPGEQHTFGLMMVAEFFRREGWDVLGGNCAPDADAATIVASEWFDVIGFSLGAEARLGDLAAAIAAAKRASCNRDLAVLVGGPLFGLHPEYVETVGADGMTIDGREAPKLAESLIVRNMPQHQYPG